MFIKDEVYLILEGPLSFPLFRGGIDTQGLDV